jgi:tetratricopeptide (TPR) repeat protein
MKSSVNGNVTQNVLTELDRTIQQRGKVEEAMLNFLRRGHLDETAVALEGAVQQHPQSAQAYELLGSVYLEQGKIEQAIAACEEAIRIDPHTELAHRQLAAAHRRRGHLDQALASLDRAIALHPDNVRYYLEAAEVLRDQAAPEDALRLVSAALAKHPADRELRQCRLELYFEAARYLNAIDEASALLHSYPNDIRALEFLAASYFYLGEPADAAAVCTRLVALAPLVPHYHLRMGALCHEMGDWQRALEEYQRTIELSPHDELAAEAWESIALLDESQLPLVMMLAAESPSFRRRLQHDPISATRERGFFLSEGALGMLLAMDFDFLGPLPAREITYY